MTKASLKIAWELVLGSGGTYKVNHNPMVSTLQDEAACRHSCIQSVMSVVPRQS
jgi:hypothetical protein